MPIPWTPPPLAEHLECLRKVLDPNNSLLPCAYQKTNVEAVIQMYENGSIKYGDTVYVMEGKRITKEEFEDREGRKGPRWIEVCGILLGCQLLSAKKL